MEFIEALVYFEKANSYENIYNDNKVEVNSLFNIALCYRRLSKFSNAISYANKCIDKVNDKDEPDKFIYASMIKFNSYMGNGDYESALELSEQLMTWMEDKSGPVAALVYNNIANVYLEKGDLNKSMEYFNKSQEIRKVKEPERLSHTIIDKSRAYIKQGLNMEASMLLQLGIDMTMKYNDQDYLLRAYYSLIEVYYSLEDFNNVENTYIKIVDIIKGRNNSELLKIYLEISKFYIKIGSLSKAEEYIELSQKIIARSY
jgi:tetratricopeptide (TPR) repeat protein